MEKPNLLEIALREGIEMKRSGRAWKGRCPFHDDKEPSFYIFKDNYYKCYGCQEHGDVIDFIKKLHGLIFPEALSYLGIENSNPLPENKKRAGRLRLLKAFNEWVESYYDELCVEYRAINTVLSNIKNEYEMEGCAPLYHRLPIIEYHFEILQEGCDADRLELYREVER